MASPHVHVIHGCAVQSSPTRQSRDRRSDDVPGGRRRGLRVGPPAELSALPDRVAREPRSKRVCSHRAQDAVDAEPGMPEAGIRGSSRGGQRTYAVSATPIMKTSHATNQDERHPGRRKLIPPAGGCRPADHREDANPDSAEDSECEGDLCPSGHSPSLPSLGDRDPH
jgi:hypothetical protein